ncbi:MAG: TIGR00269 family protein [Candidatus Aenigmatarchaeota archaeon]
MKCWKCNKEAVIYRKFEGKAWCGEHFSEQMEKKVKKTIRKEGLIDKGDKVCVALSGGKDSSLTLYLLNKILERWHDVELTALAIDEGISGYREESLGNAKKLCKELDVELKIVSFKDNFGKNLDEILQEDMDIGACTVCGVFRRWLLNKASRKMGADKLAVGHNLDDELQSIFMNYLKGDMNRLVRMGANPPLKENDLLVSRIKPLRNIPEKECGLYCLVNGIEVQEDECPYVNDSMRFGVRDFLNEMEKESPGIKFSAIHMYDNLLPILREKFEGDYGSLNKCRKCGEITNKEVCKTCKLAEKLDLDIKTTLSV